MPFCCVHRIDVHEETTYRPMDPVSLYEEMGQERVEGDVAEQREG